MRISNDDNSSAALARRFLEELWGVLKLPLALQFVINCFIAGFSAAQ
jgi:hypothetical protein